MKKLYFVSLIILLLVLLSSCQSINKKVANTIIKAQNATSIEDAISVYEDSSIYHEKLDYNLSYLYFQNKEYDKAIEIANKHLDKVNFLLIKVESYKVIDNKELYISSIKELLSLDPAYITYREALISELSPEDAKKEAELLLLYDNTNQVAIKVLSIDSEYYASLVIKEAIVEKPIEEEIVEEEEIVPEVIENPILEADIPSV